jgi:hypothetical protein
MGKQAARGRFAWRNTKGDTALLLRVDGIGRSG